MKLRRLKRGSGQHYTEGKVYDVVKTDGRGNPVVIDDIERYRPVVKQTMCNWEVLLEDTKDTIKLRRVTRGEDYTVGKIYNVTRTDSAGDHKIVDDVGDGRWATLKVDWEVVDTETPTDTKETTDIKTYKYKSKNPGKGYTIGHFYDADKVSEKQSRVTDDFGIRRIMYPASPSWKLVDTKDTVSTKISATPDLEPLGEPEETRETTKPTHYKWKSCSGALFTEDRVYEVVPGTNAASTYIIDDRGVLRPIATTGSSWEAVESPDTLVTSADLKDYLDPLSPKDTWLTLEPGMIFVVPDTETTNTTETNPCNTPEITMNTPAKIETNVTIINSRRADSMDLESFLGLIAHHQVALKSLEETGLAGSSSVIAAKIKETTETIAELGGVMDSVHSEDTDDSSDNNGEV